MSGLFVELDPPPHQQDRPTSAVLRDVQASGEDFEWYPTTSEIISQVNRDLRMKFSGGRVQSETFSILDIGAGDGRVLSALSPNYGDEPDFRKANVVRYAIEKSHTLIRELPGEVNVLGTDFHEQTLVDKPMDVTFCNPPYSEFTEWMRRIVRETRAKVTYLVVPVRWRDNTEIADAIEHRSFKVDSLGQFDFEDAPRKARAKVEVVALRSRSHDEEWRASRNDEDFTPSCDPFDEWIREHLDIATDVPVAEDPEPDVNELSKHGNLVEALCGAYFDEVETLLENYRSISRLHSSIRKQLDLTVQSILAAVRLGIKGAKQKYWRCLFDAAKSISEKLDTKRRAKLVKQMSDEIPVDFTVSNVYAVLIWVVKHANGYFDEQLVDLYRRLSEKANVVNYKSNQRVWTDEQWRYWKDADAPTRYALEYRMVLERVGGIENSEWSWRRQQCRGLSESGWDFLTDVCVVANNLGFDNDAGPGQHDWESGKANILRLRNGEPLVRVRAFKNGNMHLQFNQQFIFALNVEAGRLLGWIHNKADVEREMDVSAAGSPEILDRLFTTSRHFSLDASTVRRLTCSSSTN